MVLLKKIKTMKARQTNNSWYNKNLKNLSTKNRNKATKGEACLWKYALSKKQTGYTFKRQRPVLNFIADFMCQELSLIIEVDGSSHNKLEVQIKDMKRQKRLVNVGFKILRFTDEEVLNNMDDVKRFIMEVIVELEVRSSSL